MNEIINIIVNNGVAVAVIVYFMYRDLKYTTALNDTLSKLVESINILNILIKGKEKNDNE